MGGANVDEPNRFGCTPTFEVVMSRRLECTQLLIRNRAKLDVTNNYGLNLMQSANSAAFPTGVSEMMTKATSPHANQENEAVEDEGFNKVCAFCNKDDDTKRCSGCYIKWLGSKS